jgi:DNA-binding response OmpR family regulator
MTPDTGSPAPLPMVLVMDDEPTVREMGRRFLRNAGYGSIEADSIDAAIEMLRTTPVIAAILDVRLPGPHTGLDLLTAFRAVDDLKEIPVLIMTGVILSTEEEADIARQRGYLFYKPEGFSTIVSFLDQLTGRDRSH